MIVVRSVLRSWYWLHVSAFEIIPTDEYTGNKGRRNGRCVARPRVVSSAPAGGRSFMFTFHFFVGITHHLRPMTSWRPSADDPTVLLILSQCDSLSKPLRQRIAIQLAAATGVSLRAPPISFAADDDRVNRCVDARCIPCSLKPRSRQTIDWDLKNIEAAKSKVSGLVKRAAVPIEFPNTPPHYWRFEAQKTSALLPFLE